MSKKLTPSYGDARGVIANGFGGFGFGLICEGAGAPTDSVPGYQTGAEWHRRDGGVSTAIYTNVGNELSSTWVATVNSGVDLSTLTATAAELNRNNTASTREVLAGATLSLTQALHDGKTIAMPAVCAISLPAATGSGSRFKLYQKIAATAVTITATGAHMFGQAWLISDNSAAVLGYNAAGSTIITFDGSTQGGIKGAVVEIEDVATSILQVRVMSMASGSEASPFS